MGSGMSVRGCLRRVGTLSVEDAAGADVFTAAGEESDFFTAEGGAAVPDRAAAEEVADDLAAVLFGVLAAAERREDDWAADSVRRGGAATPFRPPPRGVAAFMLDVADTDRPQFLSAASAGQAGKEASMPPARPHPHDRALPTTTPTLKAQLQGRANGGQPFRP